MTVRFSAWGIRRKALLAGTATTALALTIGGLLLLVFLRDGVISSASTVSETVSQDLAQAYESSPLAEGRLPPSISRRGLIVQVVSEDLQVIAVSDPGASSTSLIDMFPPTGRTVTTEASGSRLLLDADDLVVSATRFTSDGSQLAVVVAVPVGGQLATVRQVGLYLLLATPLLLGIVAWGTWFLVGRALAPVNRIRSQVDAISRDRLADRVDVPATDDEIARLAHTMNQMLARLDQSDQSQRQFVADASHELRSPLATLASSVEIVRREGATSIDEMSGVMDQEITRMTRLVNNLLTLAKVDDASATPQVRLCDLDDLILTEVATARTRARHEITTDVQPVQTRCDPERVQQIIRNLLDNADRFARSTVVVRCYQEGGDAVLVVDNDGPVIPVGDRERVFERFVRLDESRSREGGSSGLGLAIVSELAKMHGGSASVSESETGMCRFTVRLPIREGD